MNPTGKFVIGGLGGGVGQTGRKFIVDKYGGAAPHRGGAFFTSNQGIAERMVPNTIKLVIECAAEKVIAIGRDTLIFVAGLNFRRCTGHNALTHSIFNVLSGLSAGSDAEIQQAEAIEMYL